MITPNLQILHNEYESTWLRTSAQLSDILSILCSYPANLMSAYAISIRIADKTLNDVSLVQPAGKPVYKEPTGYKRGKRLGITERHHNHYTLEERAKGGT